MTLRVFPLENNEMKSFEGYGQFITFVEKWESKYPALRKYKTERNSAYFTYMDFPVQVQRCIYTTNWIERLNREVQENHQHENFHAIREIRHLPPGSGGDGGNKDDI